MGKVGWYSLAVASLCAAALIGVPWTVRVSLNSAAAQNDDGLLSLLPEDAPVNLSDGSTATNNGPASDPLAGSAPAATKRLPSATPASTPTAKPSTLLDTRQQELSLRTAGTAEKPAPFHAKPASAAVRTALKPSPAAKTKVQQPAASKPKASTAKPAAKPASKPAAKPAAKPKAAPKPTAKPAAQPVKDIEAAGTTSTPAPKSDFIDQMDLPEETHPTATEAVESPSLRELFTADEVNDPDTNSAVADSAGNPGMTPGTVPPIAADETEPGHVGVIPTGSNSTDQASAAAPTLGQVLRGEAASSSTVGSSLSGYNPVRSGAMVLLVLALLFVGAWLARKFRNPLASFNQNTLSVIETVSIGPGRQLIIVEMNNDALVLGVTPHSINMLDKVPLSELNGSYQHTMNSIVKREERALPSDWEDRPLFAPNTSVHPAPALASATTYGPSGRLTVSQLRQASAYGVAGGHGAGIVPSHLLNERNTKAELIDRIRQQLSNLER
jgi:flagellar biosynthetic protein FliO